MAALFFLPLNHQQPAPGPLSPANRGARSSRKDNFIDYDNTAGVGTPIYASPEQLRGGDYDEKTDVFSLGVMLFEVGLFSSCCTLNQLDEQSV